MKKTQISLIILSITLLISNCMFFTEENRFDYYISYSINGHIFDFDSYNGDFHCESTFHIDSWSCKWVSFDAIEIVDLYFNGPLDNFEYFIYDYDDSYFTDYSSNGFTIYIDEIDEFSNYISGHFNGFIESAEFDSSTGETTTFEGSDFISGEFILPIETY